jgi:thiol-disulfide isomerase/thioredoxin
VSEPVDHDRGGVTRSEPEVAAVTAPGWLSRLGLAISEPRWALAVAGDRTNAGRSGTDLMVAIGLVVMATQLRGLASAVWLASSVDLGLGVRAAVRVVAGMLTVDLGLLVAGALAVFALAGRGRSLGRAFDLACVAALPLLYVDLGATVVVRVLGLAPVPIEVGWMLSGLAYGWMGVLIALAVRPARRASARVAGVPVALAAPARRRGWALAAIVALGIVSQARWIMHNLELVKPMTPGDPAPAFALPRIERSGELGPVITLAASHGKVTVLDFWATWCQPCLAAMPRLDQLARTHPDVAVIAINLDDRAAARAVFDDGRYVMPLVADDGEVSQRYGVSSLPHVVVIDRRGAIREVVRGTGRDLAAIVEAVRSLE